jgi:hypothetical protein
MDNKISFLNAAIVDAQDLIKFIDTKTAIIITIIGAYVVTFFVSTDKILEYSFEYSNWFWIFLTIFLILITSCIILTVRIIKPTNNPYANINFGSTKRPTLKFFLAPNDYSQSNLVSFTNSDTFKLSENFETYSKSLKDSRDSDILDSLTLELFKVSFIRNIKNDRFNTLLWLLFITTISFIISYSFYSVETHNVIEKIEQVQRLRQYSCF